jgi:hypothetical protein
MHSSPLRLRVVALAGLLAVALAGCGSTVQVRDQAQVSGGGLSGGGLPNGGLSGGLEGAGGSSGVAAGGTATTAPPGAVPGGTQGVAPGAGSASPGGPVKAGQTPAIASGGPAVTGPLTVGFVTVDYAKAISAAGGPSSGSGTRNAEQIFKDYVAAFNIAGGLAGRKIKPLYYVVDGSSNNYDSGFAAACAYFTQDNKVDMVASVGLVNSLFSGCVAKKNVPEYNGMSWTLPQAQLRKTPGYFGPVGVSHEQSSASAVDLALRQGWIKKGDKVGLVVDGCPEHQAAAKQIVQPRLSKAGVGSVTVVPYGCPKGFGSLGEMTAGMQNAVLRFRSERVKTVMYVTLVENVAHLAFVQQADSQGYVPDYVLNTTTFLAALVDTMPERQRAGMRGTGWQPVTDLWVIPAAPSPARTTCLDLLKKARIQQPRNMDELFAMFSICDLMRLMDAQLRLTNGSARISDLSATRTALKSSYTSAIGWGPVDLTDGEGPELVAPFSYRPDCKCVKFDDKPAPFGQV